MIKTLKKRWQSEKGIALVIVSIAVLTLMMIIVEFIYSTRVHYAMAANSRDRLQAEYLAKSGVQMSLLILKFQDQIDSLQKRVGDDYTLLSTGPLYEQIPIDTFLLRTGMHLTEGGAGAQAGPDVRLDDMEKKDLRNFLDFEGNFASVIEDLQGKINLNALRDTTPMAAAGEGSDTTPMAAAGEGSDTTPEQEGEAEGETGPTVSQITMEQLLALMEDDRYDDIFEGNMTRVEIASNLMDWVDVNTERDGFRGGTEDTSYASMKPSYSSKNAKYDTVEEIALVDGVTQKFMATFGKSLTVYGDSNKVNINTADRTLLFGLVARLIDSNNDAEIEEIVNWIDENRNFRDQANFLEGLSVNFGYETEDLDEFILSSLTFKSNFFLITSTGTIGDEGPDAITTTLEAVVSKNAERQRASRRTQSFRGGFRIHYWRMR